MYAAKESNINSGFNKLQSVLWPIHAHELKKFLPMCFLMFCTLYIYSLIRNLKDVFIQYAPGGGVHLFSVLKIFFVMPCAFVTVKIFSWLIDKFGEYKTFYITVSSFLIFYLIFGFIIFPNRNILHASPEQVEYLRSILPRFFYNIIPCVTNWSYTIFYIVSEMWGTMAIASLFWQFANKATKETEVKRFFGLFSTIGNTGVIFAGFTSKAMARVKTESLFDHNIKIIMCLVAVVGTITMLIFWFVNRLIINHPEFKPQNFEASYTKPTTKEKISIRTKTLLKSKYLVLIATIIVCFYVCVNFIELLGKEKMRQSFSARYEYSNIVSNLTIVKGIFSIVVNLLSANILRRCKWKTSALATPVVALACGMIFFGSILFSEFISPVFLGIQMLPLTMWMGITSDALVRSVQFSLFDTTKSMAYLPLDDNIRSKGQASVEIIAGRLGKATASAIQFLMGVVFLGQSFSSNLLFILPAFLGAAIIWIVCLSKLSVKYENAIGENKLLE